MAKRPHPGIAAAVPVGEVGQRLWREVAVLAGRLADLLEGLPADTGQLAESRAFLRSLSGPVADGGRRQAVRHAAAHPLDRLARGLALSSVEVDLLLLAGMPEEHEGLAGVLRVLHPRGEPRPTVGLAAQLLCHSLDERRLLRETIVAGPLVRHGAVVLDPQGPFPERSFLPAEELWPALHGLDAWPAALPRRTEPVATAGLEAWFDSMPASLAIATLRRSDRCTLFVTADGAEVAWRRAAAMAARAGVTAVHLLPAQVTVELERLISLHALVRGTVPVLGLPAGDRQGAPEAPRFLDHPGPVILSASTGSAIVSGPRPVIVVPAGRLAPPARRKMWSGTLPELASSAPYLAARHAVEPSAAAEAAADVRHVVTLEGRDALVEDVAASVRARAALSVSGGVDLYRPTVGWEQLVLAPDRLAQLREALDRLVHQPRVLDDWGFLRGRPGARGVRMLCAGPPGTGKTLAAEVMAHELGVELLAVDISRVVSKWIGETEKNLAEVFDTAERAESVLFFDEADALFGRRTDVSDAHDRYANLETAYLLARLERFEGLTILSTNLRQNVDPAFIRRLEFVVDFDEPGPAERAALWQCHLPAAAPLAPDVDLQELVALYPIVGALIRNAAVAAGFLAAAEGGPITRSHLVRAVRREYEKSGRAFPGVPAGAVSA
jgi:hypothetical protein